MWYCGFDKCFSPGRGRSLNLIMLLITARLHQVGSPPSTRWGKAVCCDRSDCFHLCAEMIHRSSGAYYIYFYIHNPLQLITDSITQPQCSYRTCWTDCLFQFDSVALCTAVWRNFNLKSWSCTRDSSPVLLVFVNAFLMRWETSYSGVCLGWLTGWNTCGASTLGLLQN